MVLVLIAFPLLMIGTLLYVGLAIHEETTIESHGAGQTGCVACTRKKARETFNPESTSATIVDERELVAA